MNTKLDIVRFECDDVIATSSVCAHADSIYHFYLSDQHNNVALVYNKCDQHNGKYWTSTMSAEVLGISVPGWYYMNEEYDLEPCTESHNYIYNNTCGASGEEGHPLGG